VRNERHRQQRALRAEHAVVPRRHRIAAKLLIERAEPAMSALHEGASCDAHVVLARPGAVR